MNTGTRTLLLDLAGVAAASRSVLERRLVRLGLALDDLMLVSAIDHPDSGGTSVAQLAHALDSTPSKVLRAIRPLEKLGWVERTATGFFTLTASGKLVEQEGREICGDTTEKILATHFEGHETADLADLLTRLAVALHR